MLFIYHKLFIKFNALFGVRLKFMSFHIFILSKFFENFYLHSFYFLQYRMHPEICRFPSVHFYDKKLLNGDKMSSKSTPFHEIEGLGPYVFYDIVDGQEHRGKNSGAMSLYNEYEANAAVEVLRFFKKRCSNSFGYIGFQEEVHKLLRNVLLGLLLLIFYLDILLRYPSEFVGGRIGIITPYKCQQSLLRSRFSSAFGSSVIDDMEFNTVDGFQGREVDILLLSTVRAGDPSTTALGNNSSSIGFVADVRRMNVALTRAKLSLWILGNARTLRTNRNWAALIKDAKERNLVISVKKPYESMFKTAFHKNAAPGISDNHSRQQKHVEKAKDASQHAKQNESIAKETVERKTKDVGCAYQSKKKGIRCQKDFPVIRENIPSDGRSARDEYQFPVKKDSSPLVTNDSSRTSEDVKHAISGKQVAAGARKGKESSEKKESLGNTHMSKRREKFENLMSNSDHSERESSDSHNVLKSQVHVSPSTPPFPSLPLPPPPLPLLTTHHLPPPETFPLPSHYYTHQPTFPSSLNITFSIHRPKIWFFSPTTSQFLFPSTSHTPLPPYPHPPNYLHNTIHTLRGDMLLKGF
jgi:hypothetical protein